MFNNIKQKVVIRDKACQKPLILTSNFSNYLLIANLTTNNLCSVTELLLDCMTLSTIIAVPTENNRVARAAASHKSFGKNSTFACAPTHPPAAEMDKKPEWFYTCAFNNERIA